MSVGMSKTFWPWYDITGGLSTVEECGVVSTCTFVTTVSSSSYVVTGVYSWGRWNGGTSACLEIMSAGIVSSSTSSCRDERFGGKHASLPRGGLLGWRGVSRRGIRSVSKCRRFRELFHELENQ